MAAIPPEITIRNISGTYILNRTLSDNSQAVLKQQNVGWLVRQAVQYSNIDVTLTQYTTTIPPGEPHAGDQRHHLDQYQSSTGGIRNVEDRVMDWEATVKPNKIWGEVRARTHYTTVAKLPDAWLREGWEKECVEGEVIEGIVEGVKDGWTAHQVWGFAEVEGQRRHVRKILAQRKGWKDERIRMVYDWRGPVEEKNLVK